jgi:signal transduction histidine kinase
MRYFFRGKRGGLLLLLAIAGLVLGGLGWVTFAALRLEREQLAARAEADFSTRLQLALWRLDARISIELAKEANRPYHQYSAIESAIVQSKSVKNAPDLTVVNLYPVENADVAPWMTEHFLLGQQSEWKSPQALRDSLVRHWDLSNTRPPTGQASAPFPAGLANDTSLKKVWNLYDNNANTINAAPPQVQQEPAKDDSRMQQAVQQATNSGRGYQQGGQGGQPGDQKFDPNTQLRRERSAFEKGAVGNEMLNPPQPSGNNPTANRGGRDQRQVLAILGPPIPLWLTDEQQGDRLVVARLVQIGPKMAAQVTLVNWGALQELLAEVVRGDLFPEARFVPVKEDESEHPERAMSVLPVELVPGSPTSEEAIGWTPLRVGLALAWVASLTALLAVGLGGWSLLDLSERRIRFVSAVTHELRTPLTTLRLYLDMLTGGVVKDEQQKTEYLQTLHAESDRLHRLIGNVLDFSRLENQRPRLEKTTVTVGEVLEQLRGTWDDRCQSAGKQLSIETLLAGEVQFVTDVKLVHQILGNLIDNACKYSRGAEDRHIWVRAYGEGRQRLVFEVEDRGPGIPPRERRSIFRPFRRGRDADVAAGGVGLGLALAQSWAQLLGGKLMLRVNGTQPGACFRLELPF